MKRYTPSTFPDIIDPLIFFQDITATNKKVYDQYYALIAKGKYDEATELINSADNLDGFFAGLFNMLESRIHNSQEYLLDKFTRVIYSFTPPERPGHMVNNDTIWIDCELEDSSRPSGTYTINERIIDNSLLRFYDEENDKFVAPSLFHSYKDVYMNSGKSLKDELDSYLISSPVWVGGKTFSVTKEEVNIYVTFDDDRAILTDDDQNVVTMNDKYIAVQNHSDVDISNNDVLWTLTGDVITTKNGAGLKLKSGANHDAVQIRFYSPGGDLIHYETLEYTSTVINDPNTPVVEVNGYASVNLRIMSNLSTMLWDKLSLITQSDDVYVYTSTPVKIMDYLSTYTNRVTANNNNVYAGLETLGYSRSSVGDLENIPAKLKDADKPIVDTINTLCSDDGDNIFNVETPDPYSISLFIKNKMFTSIIDAVHALAERKGIPISTYTVRECINVLQQVSND